MVRNGPEINPRLPETKAPWDAVILTVIVFALWRIFFGFSSGGLSMWRFE